MNLTLELLPKYLTYIFFEETPEQINAKVESWRSQISEGKRELKNYFVHLTGSEIDAAIHLVNFHESNYAIMLPSRVLRDPVDPAHLEILLKEAMVRLGELKGKAELRLVEKPHLLPLAPKLAALGFRLSHTRIEYQAPVSDLPSEEGSPFEWIPCSESGRFPMAEAAEILGQCGVGDPDWNPEDNTLELLQSYVGDAEFESGLDCIQVGLIEGKPAAVVVAQVIPKDGWSRITYMGMKPEFRGKGLGKWVHRRGFALMKAKGGKLYHGGTVRGNAAMEALFRGHGCKEFRTMQEWRV